MRTKKVTFRAEAVRPLRAVSTMALVITLVGAPIPALRADPAPIRDAGRAGSKSSRTLGRVADPEAAMLMLRLLVRYADNVQDKDDLDLRIERQLGSAPESRNAIRRLTSRYLAMPSAERRALFGERQQLTADAHVPLERYRDLVKRLGTPRLEGPRVDQREASQERAKLPPKHFRSESPTQPDEPDDAPRERGKRPPRKPRDMQSSIGASAPADGPRLLPVSLTTMQPAAERYQLFYNGLWAHHETDEDHVTDSDEIYAIFTIVDGAGNVVTTRRPSRTDPPYHWDVDSGEYRPKSKHSSRIWGGADGRPAQDVVLSVSLFEQDSGDPADTEAALKGIWGAAGAMCVAAVGANAAAVCAAALIFAVGIQVVVMVFLGGGDDEIETKSIEISADELEEMADSDLTTFREEDIPCHFRLVHNGSDNSAGADYHTYFAVRIAE